MLPSPWAWQAEHVSISEAAEGFYQPDRTRQTHLPFSCLSSIDIKTGTLWKGPTCSFDTSAPRSLRGWLSLHGKFEIFLSGPAGAATCVEHSLKNVLWCGIPDNTAGIIPYILYHLQHPHPSNYSMQKHKPLFIISKVSRFISGACSSISFTALTAVNRNSFSSTWEQEVVFYWFFPFWKGWKFF